MSRRPALAVVDTAALVTRAYAGDWRAVDDLIGSVVASDYAPDVMEILTRLVVEYLEKLKDATGYDTLDELVASAAEAVGVDGA